MKRQGRTYISMQIPGSRRLTACLVFSLSHSFHFLFISFLCAFLSTFSSIQFPVTLKRRFPLPPPNPVHVISTTHLFITASSTEQYSNRHLSPRGETEAFTLNRLISFRKREKQEIIEGFRFEYLTSNNNSPSK